MARGKGWPLVLAAVILVVGACGADGDETGSSASTIDDDTTTTGEATTSIAGDVTTTTGEPTTTADDGNGDGEQDAYCVELTRLFELLPNEATTNYSLYADHAEQAERVAEVAPPEHREPLLAIATYSRAIAESSPDVLELFEETVDDTLLIAGIANSRCGIEPFDGGRVDPSTTTLPEGPQELAPDRVEAIAAAVPAGLGVTFIPERVELDDGGYPVVVAIPDGWERSESFSPRWSAPEGFGFFTELEVDARCNGLCRARDWETDLYDTSDSSPFQGADDPDATVVTDEVLSDPAGRLLVIDDAPGVADRRIIVVRWWDEADRYFQCEASLDEDDLALTDAFVEVCTTAIPLWLR